MSPRRAQEAQNECQEVSGSLSGSILAPFLKPFSDVFSGPCFQRMPREKAKRHKRNSPRKQNNIRTSRPSRHSRTFLTPRTLSRNRDERN